MEITTAVYDAMLDSVHHNRHCFIRVSGTTRLTREYIVAYEAAYAGLMEGMAYAQAFALAENAVYELYRRVVLRKDTYNE